jgi:hypothetical protein
MKLTNCWWNSLTVDAVSCKRTNSWWNVQLMKVEKTKNWWNKLLMKLTVDETNNDETINDETNCWWN